MSHLKGAPAVVAALIAPCFAVALLALATHAVPESVIQKYRARMIATMIGESTGFVARTPDFVLSRDAKENLIARGHDKSGRKWRVIFPAADRELWWTRQGQDRTYYFDGYTGGAGMAPQTWILALSFDEVGRPVPFYITTHTWSDIKGLRDLLQFDASDQVLLQQTWVEDAWNDHARSGYYVTSAYCRQGAYWHRCDGLHGSISFPIFEKWNTMPDTEPKRVPPPDHQEAYVWDLGNDPQSGRQTTIIDWGHKKTLTQPDLGCELGSMNVIVADGPSGREIEAGFFFPGQSGTLLPQVIRRRKPVILTGIIHWPRDQMCDASVMWSTF